MIDIMKRVKGIIFDFDNTLVDTKGADAYALEEVKKFLDLVSLKTGASEVIHRFKKLLAQSEKDPTGVVPIDEWRTNLWLQAMEDNSQRDTAEQVYRLWKLKRLENIRLSEDIRVLLLNLKKSYKLLLLTNGDPQVQREKLDHCSGWDFFESVMISGDFCYEKPNPAIFEDAFQRLHLMKDQCIMVGDSLGTDIQGGINADLLATVWITSSEEDISSVHPRPHFKLDSVLKLHEVLDKLN